MFLNQTEPVDVSLASNPKNFRIKMNDLFDKVELGKYLIISETELNELLKTSQIINQQDTRIRDMIRILKLENHLYLQEKTNLGEIIIRKFDSETDAMKLLNERMEIYDKMWDGCGCKINYYE
jgi:hypothetical protein